MVHLQLLSIHDRAVGVTNLGVMLLWSPEKPKAYLAGNQKSGRDRLSADAADQIHGFMNPRE